jgi:hypothetical protein
VLQFKNYTPFVGSIAVFPDADGIDALFAVVKGTFTLGAELAIAEEQVPVAMAPTYHADPSSSSLKMASDVSLMKSSTDVLVMGNACAPHGRLTRMLDVGVAVAGVQQVVRVYGDRVWVRSGPAYAVSPPEPFELMPLVWERAFGGRDVTDSGPREEPRNPVGTGFRASDGQSPVEGTPLPNLEDPRDPIISWKQQPQPVCFAPIPPNWEPRRSYGGTYDDAWQTQRAPYLPDDFDPRFLQIAPPALVTPQPLQGGEIVQIVGMRPEGPMQLTLPALRPRIQFHMSGSTEERPVMLDTVIVEPTDLRLQMVWRASLPCDKKTLKIREVEATLAEMA